MCILENAQDCKAHRERDANIYLHLPTRTLGPDRPVSHTAAFINQAARGLAYCVVAVLDALVVIAVCLRARFELRVERLINWQESFGDLPGYLLRPFG